MKQFEKGVEQLRKTVELDPLQYNSRLRLGFAYAAVHRYVEAESEFRKAEEISPDSVTSLAALTYVYGLEGKKTQAEAMVSELQKQAMKTGHPSLVSLAYIGLDDKDQAIHWLEKAHDQRDTYLNLFMNFGNPILDPLRSNPMFQELERRVRIAQQPESQK
jgi:tetratricopeptide (TPR) repeat protein